MFSYTKEESTRLVTPEEIPGGAWSVGRMSKDKVIVITGASSGIGAAVAELVAKRGARGVVIAARRESELAQVAGKLGNVALAVPTDVAKRADVDRLRDRAIAKFGHIDVWINNAGRGISRPVSQLVDADIDEMIAVNVKSVLYGMQAVLPHFKERRRGQIITISSLLSRFPFAAVRSAYSAAKAAVNLLDGSLRAELRAEFPDIATTLVLPGVVATDFGKHATHGGADSRALPNAQPVDEVAAVIADAIDHPRAEVYTRPQYRELAARYFAAEDIAKVEAQPPFGIGGPPR
jgi:NADP-dependent 3-hydroxy acid dehydrogenase YdfG